LSLFSQCGSQNMVFSSFLSVLCFCPKPRESNSSFTPANSSPVRKRESGGKRHSRRHHKKVCLPKSSTLVSLSKLPSIDHSLIAPSVGSASSSIATSPSSTIVSSHFSSAFPSPTISSKGLTTTIPSSIPSAVSQSLSSFHSARPSTTLSLHSYDVATFGSICSGPSSVPTLPSILSDFQLVDTNCGSPNLPTIFFNLFSGPLGPSECAQVCESAGDSCAYFAISGDILCQT
jgi:hypothetical protein